MNATKIRQKALQKFGNDPLYKAVIVANNEKDMKQAIKILKSIRGAPAFTRITTYIKKLHKESMKITKTRLKEIIKEEVALLKEKKIPKKSDPPAWHQHRIAVDTVKNPMKALLGNITVEEYEEILRDKFGYNDKDIAKLKK